MSKRKKCSIVLAGVVAFFVVLGIIGCATDSSQPDADSTPAPPASPTVAAATATPTPSLAPQSPITPLPTAPAATATPTATAAPTATPTPEPTATPQVGRWRGIILGVEHRCSDYDPGDYPYPQSVEPHIVASMGGIIYGPYTGTWFDSTSETDIEHIVARSEAHDSGLCAADAATKRRFASDLLNLTLASPAVNRSQKSGKDAAEWLPDLNQCWFAKRVVEVRQRYALTIDDREALVLEGILSGEVNQSGEVIQSGCTSTEREMVVLERSAQAATPTPTPDGSGIIDALQMYDDNGNGRITCAEARNHGIAPVRRGHPAYPHMDDRDGDGVVCE